MSTIELLTIPQWAERLGISRQAAWQAVRRLAIPVQPGGLIDAVAATAVYNAKTQRRVRVAARQTASAGVGPSYDEARRRSAVAEAERAELELAELKGDLVRLATVKASLARQYIAAREIVLGWPARTAPLLIGVADQGAVEAVLHAEVHRLLEHLAAMKV
jgi:hypothetical protein